MGVLQLEILAPMVMLIVAILTTGTVLILRPIAKRLGALLEVMTRERLEGSGRADLEHVREMLDTMNQRLALMEERQDFTDRLLQSGDRDRPSAIEGDLKASPADGN